MKFHTNPFQKGSILTLPDYTRQYGYQQYCNSHLWFSKLSCQPTNFNWTAIAGIFGTVFGVLITKLFTSKSEKRRLKLDEKRFDIEHSNILESEIKCNFMVLFLHHS